MLLTIFNFLQEKAAWEQLNGVSVEELKRLSLESLDSTKKKKSGCLSGHNGVKVSKILLF